MHLLAFLGAKEGRERERKSSLSQTAAVNTRWSKQAVEPPERKRTKPLNDTAAIAASIKRTRFCFVLAFPPSVTESSTWKSVLALAFYSIGLAHSDEDYGKHLLSCGSGGIHQLTSAGRSSSNTFTLEFKWWQSTENKQSQLNRHCSFMLLLSF